uniref:Radical SAM additional 4Fe4S-binding SPASM domain-containing protein n=1 Tax=Candidatus Kentrum sp. MB TaxID=2138164 RepID=A0A450XGN1_9GAMM|nr:MAG: radical SAM additional 4Fe4S-binding SPASM domain-containing protein [Candidatus Kentron sp. MB]VFK28460.1 MAG: radical SAM additional 4Fe4S-binding SPASM domain-containing protein [Candidatus Kentron sp. MB]VFK74262.1 MAG: radical SAM additional 4Fe4S-binding SPASM domain-containing protein [Candidatus Kentron sp. MB]
MKAAITSKLNLDQRTRLEEVIPLRTPFLLYVDPSSACNFKCRFCPTGHKDLLRVSEYKRGILDFTLFEKLIRDLETFPNPLKVMRMNKIGEPLLNKKLPEMIALAKAGGCVEYIDLATNAALFSPVLLSRLVESGLDRINISLEGINREQYLEHAQVDFDFDQLVGNIRWLYAHRGKCEVTIKIPANLLGEGDRERFFDLFGDYCDRIFVEELSPIWPEFDLEQRANITVRDQAGQYQPNAKDKQVCTYIFYAMAINSDGTVSACCPDWDQRLLIGDLHRESLLDIWNSPQLRQLQRSNLQGKRGEHPICKACGHVKYAQVDDIDDHKESLLRKFDGHRSVEVAPN